MIKNKRTKILKEIRRQIRHAVKWHNSDDGMPTHWSSLNYKRAKRMKGLILTAKEKNYHYYTRSSRAIEEIAVKLYDSITKSLSTFANGKSDIIAVKKH